MIELQAPRVPIDSPRRIYVDTSVLVQFPQVLARKREGMQLIIPQPVLDELSGNRSTMAGSLRELIEEAVQAGSVTVEPMPEYSNGAFEIALIRHIRSTTHPYKALATEDRAFDSPAREMGVQVIRGRDLIYFLKHGPAPSEFLYRRVRRFELSSWVVTVAIGGALTQGSYLLSFAPPLLEWAIANAGITGIVAALPVGLGLLALRARKPLFYGAIEVLVGLASVQFGARELRRLAETDILATSAILSVLGGLYIVVRGLDNMHKGSSGTWLERPFAKLTAQ